MIDATNKSKRRQERRNANHAENLLLAQTFSESFNRRETFGGQILRNKLCTDLSMIHHKSKIELSRPVGQIRKLYIWLKQKRWQMLLDRSHWIHNWQAPLWRMVGMKDGCSSYLLGITEEDGFRLFPLETLVYLTPDSEHTLQDYQSKKSLHPWWTYGWKHSEGDISKGLGTLCQDKLLANPGIHAQGLEWEKLSFRDTGHRSSI